MSILEQLWLGNICPQEMPVTKGSEYAQVLQKMLNAREDMLPHLSSKTQIAIDNLMDIQLEANALAQRDAFIMGFRLGVQLMVDALQDPTPPLG